MKKTRQLFAAALVAGATAMAPLSAEAFWWPGGWGGPWGGGPWGGSPWYGGYPGYGYSYPGYGYGYPGYGYGYPGWGYPYYGGYTYPYSSLPESGTTGE